MGAKNAKDSGFVVTSSPMDRGVTLAVFRCGRGSTKKEQLDNLEVASFTSPMEGSLLTLVRFVDKRAVVG